MGRYPTRNLLCCDSSEVISRSRFSCFHSFNVFLRQQHIVDPINRELNQNLKVLDILGFPLSSVVRFVIAELSSPLGTGLDVLVGDILGDARAKRKIPNVVFFIWMLRHSEIL